MIHEVNYFNGKEVGHWKVVQFKSPMYGAPKQGVRYQHTGPITDYFGTLLKKGDKIVRFNMVQGRHCHTHENYIERVDNKEKVLYTRCFNEDGTLKPKVTKVTSINPHVIFIDHEWKRKQNEKENSSL